MATKRSARSYTTAEVLDKLFDDSDDETDNLEELNGTECMSGGESDADDMAPSTSAIELQGDDDDDIDPSTAAPNEGHDLNESFQLSCKKSKLLTAKKLVNSLDACLEEGNFDAVDVPIHKETFTSYLEMPKRKNSPGKKIHWTNQPPRPEGRQNSVNVIRGPVGVKGAAKKETDSAGC